MLDNSGRYSISPTRKAYTMEAETQLRQRVAMLQNEFAVIDANQDTWISRDELYRYLDRKSGKVFDRAIADDIFEQMDKDQDNRVTINEFIKVYIQAEEILRTKIEKARLARDAYKKEEDEYLVKAQKASANENYAGAASQSGIAHVSIREAVISHQTGGTLNLFVEVYLDRQQIAKTKVVPYAEQGARWEEKFAFDIPNPRSEVKLILYDRGAFVSGYFLGQALLPVSGFTDQELHQMWVNLVGKDNQNVVGQLLIELQWIYSKARYYSSLAEKCRENYIRAEEDAKDYEVMLQKLHEPFLGMQVVHEAKDIQTKYPGLSTRDQKFVATINKVANKLGQGDTSNQGAWQKLALLLSVLWLIVGVFLMFGRPAFFDVACPIILLLYIRQGSLGDVISLRIIAFVILGSIVLQDLIWAVVYWGDWEFNESQGIRNSSTLKNFVWLMTLICVVLKGIMALVCYTLNIQSTLTKGAMKRPVMRNVEVTTTF